MSDQEWSELCELWGMSERDIILLWGFSKPELEVVPFCRHLATCSKRRCGCCDCKMYAAVTDKWSVGNKEKEMSRARALKYKKIERVLRRRIAAGEAREVFCELERERIAVIRELLTADVSKIRLQDEQ